VGTKNRISAGMGNYEFGFLQLTVRAKLVSKLYEKGKRVSNDQMKSLPISCHDKFPKWNYTFSLWKWEI